MTRKPSHVQSQCPMIPVRGSVVFPNLKFSCTIGRRPSVLALEKALSEDQIVLLVTQLDDAVDNPTPEQVHKVGTLMFISQYSYSPGNDLIAAYFEGIERAEILRIEETNGYWQATFRRISEPVKEPRQAKKLLDHLTTLIEERIERTQSFFWSKTQLEEDMWNDDPSQVADSMASNLRMTVRDKQEILELSSVRKRLARLIEIISRKLETED